jgi:hypothetical protein
MPDGPFPRHHIAGGDGLSPSHCWRRGIEFPAARRCLRQWAGGPCPPREYRLLIRFGGADVGQGRLGVALDGQVADRHDPDRTPLLD